MSCYVTIVTLFCLKLKSKKNPNNYCLDFSLVGYDILIPLKFSCNLQLTICLHRLAFFWCIPAYHLYQN